MGTTYLHPNAISKPIELGLPERSRLKGLSQSFKMVMDFAMFYSLLRCETLTNKQYDFFLLPKLIFFPTDFWDINFKLLLLSNRLTDIIVLGGICFIFLNSLNLSWIFLRSINKYLQYNL